MSRACEAPLSRDRLAGRSGSARGGRLGPRGESGESEGRQPSQSIRCPSDVHQMPTNDALITLTIDNSGKFPKVPKPSESLATPGLEMVVGIGG